MTLNNAVRERTTQRGPAETEDVTALVNAARSNESGAWTRLIRRYTPMVNGVAGGFRLPAADVEDIVQTVWLRCFQNLSNLRDPRALPGWLKTTTYNEALRLLNSASRTNVVCREMQDQLIRTGQTECPELAEELMKEEVVRTIQNGLDELNPKERHLLTLLYGPSEPSYQEISNNLDMPKGSIGPSRARYLKKLSKTNPVARYLDQDQLAISA